MNISQFLSIVEIRTKIVSMSTFSIAVLYTLYATGHISWLHLILMGLATLSVDMGTTAFNIFFDYRRGVDHADHTVETEKVLVHEGVAPGAAFLTAAALFFFAVLLGLVLSFLTGWQVGAAGALSMMIGYLYTGGPYPISRTPFGELFAGGFLGPVLFLLTYHVIAGYLPEFRSIGVRPFAVSLPSFFLISSILTVNNTCDIEGDKSAGRRTFSIIFGRRAGETAVYLLGAGCYGSLIILALHGVLPRGMILWTAGAAVLSFPEYLKMHRRSYTHASKGPSMNSISKIFLLYTLAMWGGLGIPMVLSI